MRIVPGVEAEIRRVIRDERAKDPLISVQRLKEALEEKYERGFSYQYVSKISEKVAREALVEVDRTKIEQRINFTRENYRMMRERLLEIVYWKPPPVDELTPENVANVKRPINRDVIEACKNLVMLDLALLNAEISAGMYRTPQEAAAGIRYAPMPEEKRSIVITAFINWGMIPKEQVEAMVPQLENGAPNTTAS